MNQDSFKLAYQCGINGMTKFAESMEELAGETVQDLDQSKIKALSGFHEAFGKINQSLEIIVTNLDFEKNHKCFFGDDSP